MRLFFRIDSTLHIDAIRVMEYGYRLRLLGCAPRPGASAGQVSAALEDEHIKRVLGAFAVGSGLPFEFLRVNSKPRSICLLAAFVPQFHSAVIRLHATAFSFF